MEENIIGDATELSKRLIYPLASIPMGANTTTGQLEGGVPGFCDLIIVDKPIQEARRASVLDFARFLRAHFSDPIEDWSPSDHLSFYMTMKAAAAYCLYGRLEPVVETPLQSELDLEAEEQITVHAREAFAAGPIPEVQAPITIPPHMLSLIPGRYLSRSFSILIPEDFEE
jgi:hypothetical protein